MYEEFYGLSGKPFQLTPDPRFFFSSTGHKRAMAYMQYGLQQEQGFIVVTGDVGTGKSMLVSNLFNTLDEERLVAAKIVSTNIKSNDLIRLLCTELEIPHERKSKASLLNNLEARFREHVEDGKHVLLVIDEAQNLPRESLEELRMLSNFEHESKPLVQSFLLGQREFRRMLRAPGLEQLRQRVIAAYHLGPLPEKELASYVKHRLRVVGWQNDPELEEGIFAAVHKATGGVPRRINTFFDRLMLASYLDERHTITVDAVAEVAEEVEQEIRGPEPTAGQTAEDEAAPAEGRQVQAPAVNAEAERVVNERLDRLERQLGTISSQLGDLARNTAPQAPPPGAYEARAGESKRWTMLFAGMAVCAVLGACAVAYLVLA